MSETAAPPPSSSDRPAPRGLVGRIAAAWSGRHRETIRADLRGEITESRLLACAMGVGLLMLLASLPSALAERMELAVGGAAGELPSVAEIVTMHVVANLFFLPLFLYGVAALARLLLRLFGGDGGWQASRVAVFWGLLVAAPAVLLGAAAESLLRVAEIDPRLAEAPATLAGIASLWFLCAGLAEAHGFRRAWPGFLLVLALWAAEIYAFGLAPQAVS